MLKKDVDTELTLMPDLFSTYSSVLYWKIDFFVVKINKLNQQTPGTASLILLVNSVPSGGYCFLDKYNGISLLTIFNIKCLNWMDKDGYVAKYEFFGMKELLM